MSERDDTTQSCGQGKFGLSGVFEKGGNWKGKVDEGLPDIPRPSQLCGSLSRGEHAGQYSQHAQLKLAQKENLASSMREVYDKCKEDNGDFETIEDTLSAREYKEDNGAAKEGSGPRCTLEKKEDIGAAKDDSGGGDGGASEQAPPHTDDDNPDTQQADDPRVATFQPDLNINAELIQQAITRLQGVYAIEFWLEEDILVSALTHAVHQTVRSLDLYLERRGAGGPTDK